jgi:mitochondrial inner membrane protease ATP23
MLQACVRHLAVISVAANPAYRDWAMAERAIDELWESCFNGAWPFDEVRCPFLACVHLLTLFTL